MRELSIPPYRPRVPFEACQPELYTLMLRCWTELPSDRPESDRVRSQLKQVPGNRSGNLMDDLLQRMERYAKDLETLVNERTAAFMDEKKRSEELLYQMLPRYVITYPLGAVRGLHGATNFIRRDLNPSSRLVSLARSLHIFLCNLKPTRPEYSIDTIPQE